LMMLGYFFLSDFLVKWKPFLNPFLQNERSSTALFGKVGAT
jgi:hypothetical protein